MKRSDEHVSGDLFDRFPRMSMLVLQLALPHYRQGLIKELSSDEDIVFVTGDSQFQEGVYVGVEGPNVVRVSSNKFYLGRRLASQHIPWRVAMNVDTLVVELNPRILNSWAYLVLRRIMGRRTLAWGHVFPRAGRGAHTEWVRRVMRSLTDGMIVYTKREASDFREMHPDTPAFVATNALYRRAELGARDLPTPGRQFIMIGRLVQSKKPRLVLDAFRKVVEKHDDVILRVVGSGPLEDELLRDSEDLVATGRVRFEGEVSDVDELRQLFHNSVALVCGGYVGLNVTQAIGFGIPVIFPEKEPHAPEVDLLNRSNSIPFAADSSESLSEVMSEAWRERMTWAQAGPELSEAVVEHYSVEGMAQGFRQAAKGSRNARR